jgi:hypothetical protein
MSKSIATVPATELIIEAIDHLIQERHTHHAIYSPLFQRHESREGAAKYLHSLWLGRPHKSIEPMV